MIVLGIESTAHTFGVSIIKDREVLSDERSVYKPKKGQGILPREAADHHSEAVHEVLKKALVVNPKEIDLISYSQGPGLPPCLRVGSVLARNLALKYKKPLIGVNHCVAHLEVSKMLNPEIKSPVMLYVSGGNTQVIAFENNKYRIFGETLDISLGNLIDVFGRYSELDFPAGPAIEQLAKKGSKLIELPYAVKGMDVSFSGILTNLKNKLKNYKLEDLCYSLQEYCFAMLVEVSERAMAHCKKNELIVAGGVAANQRLQEMCRIMCSERGAKFYPMSLKYAGDNPVMIAWLGLNQYKQGIRTKISEKVNPNWRPDQV